MARVGCGDSADGGGTASVEVFYFASDAVPRLNTGFTTSYAC
jgi:hypothetical protein